MITPDEYPAYNHRERPGIGRDHLGNTFYNCFSVKLEKDKYNRYRPFLFRDFINQYNRYAKYSGTCSSCISTHAIITFPADDKNVDRSAVHRKFANGEIESADYYYCPLTQQVLSASQLSIAPSSQEKLRAEPIQAILSDNWDDSYLFEFLRIVPPQQMGTCPDLEGGALKQVHFHCRRAKLFCPVVSHNVLPNGHNTAVGSENISGRV